VSAHEAYLKIAEDLTVEELSGTVFSMTCALLADATEEDNRVEALAVIPSPSFNLQVNGEWSFLYCASLLVF